MYSSTLSLTLALDEGGWSRPHSGHFKRPGTLCIGGWVGPRAGLDKCGKSRPKWIRSPDRPALASRYTDCASTRNISWKVKDGLCVRQKILSHSCKDCLEILAASNSLGTVQIFNGVALLYMDRHNLQTEALITVFLCMRIIFIKSFI
jgi:hypothetical protein